MKIEKEETIYLTFSVRCLFRCIGARRCPQCDRITSAFYVGTENIQQECCIVRQILYGKSRLIHRC